MAVEILLRTQESETPFVQLLLAVFNSILEVFILCAAGYTLARHGILDKKTQKPHPTQQINRLNVSLFTPALLFSKVAFFLTPGGRLFFPCYLPAILCFYSSFTSFMLTGEDGRGI
ncbi:hypothetical protein NLJ89_g7282 [Agrocybe chaxingu]|uniref:Uncharacterized protein n=1 Tax=Agrocybe chaxingu TaxID=84603 RepID=A0A9W8MV75_9AGAR|nr:hypothetical protein NLJ89_g7282 [Agrocybe chaxingu]